MPAKDPQDQAAARDFEQMLRYYVFSGRAPQSKLDWFMSLPKRVRRSRQLIAEALGPEADALERIREARESLALQRFERIISLPKLRVSPRDLSFLHTEGARPWDGIGRRKQRCRRFNQTGRAYMVRNQLVDKHVQSPHPCIQPAPVQPPISMPPCSLLVQPPPAASTSRPLPMPPAHTLLVPPSRPLPTPPARPLPVLPTRSLPVPPPATEIHLLDSLRALQQRQDPYYFTPRALVDAVEDLIWKVRGKDPYSSPSYSELHSPNPEYVPSPVASHCISVPFDIQAPFSFTTDVWIPSQGRAIDGQVLTILSYGRIGTTPWLTHTVDELAASLAESERQDSVGLQRFMDALFPNGPLDLSTALIPTQAVSDMFEAIETFSRSLDLSNAHKRTIDWHVSEEVRAARQATLAKLGPRPFTVKRGVLLRYARDVAPASEGAYCD